MCCCEELPFNGNPADFLNGAGQFVPMFDAGDYPDIYVALDGDDSNNGLSEDAPFLSIKAAIELAIQSSSRSRIHLAGGEYDGAELRTPRPLNRPFELIGTDFTELFGNVTVLSWVAASRTLTVTPDPGWAVNQWEGAFVQFVSGPSGVAPDSGTKNIVSNTSNSLVLSYPPNNPSGLPPVAGDVYHIVEPAAKLLNLADDLEGLSVPGGSSYSTYISNYQTNIDACLLRNIDIVSSATVQIPNTAFSGSWVLYGTRFVCTVANHWIVDFIDGSVDAGSPVNQVDTTGFIGWGIVAKNTVGSRRPSLRFNRCRARLYTVVGQMIAMGGSIVLWHGGSARDSSANFPHGTIASLSGSHIYQLSNATAGRFYVSSAVGEHDFVVENAFIEIDVPITHEGTGGFIRGRYGCAWKIARNPVAVGTGLGLLCEYGATGRITAVDGSTLGPATAGATVALGQVTRAAAPWAAGNSVVGAANIPRDLSNIFRDL